MAPTLMENFLFIVVSLLLLPLLRVVWHDWALFYDPPTPVLETSAHSNTHMHAHAHADAHTHTEPVRRAE